MADDVDPSRSPTAEPSTADEFGVSEASSARVESMEIAMVEIEIVEFETPEEGTVDKSNDVQPPAAEVRVATAEPEPTEPVRPPEPAEPIDPLPTMADLDRVASELDDIDARLASLDEQRS